MPTPTPPTQTPPTHTQAPTPIAGCGARDKVVAKLRKQMLSVVPKDTPVGFTLQHTGRRERPRDILSLSAPLSTSPFCRSSRPSASVRQIFTFSPLANL
eukprot:3957144-Pleurochrysis_carterae.AAC.1